ncbi:MAG: hypothetical protein AB8G96_06050 [Phycisphaerales bacterium]
MAVTLVTTLSASDALTPYSDPPLELFMIAIGMSVIAASASAGHELIGSGRERLGWAVVTIGAVSGFALSGFWFLSMIGAGAWEEGMALAGLGVGLALLCSFSGLLLAEPTPSAAVRIYRRLAVGLLVGCAGILLAIGFIVVGIIILGSEWVLDDIGGQGQLEMVVISVLTLAYTGSIVGLLACGLVPGLLQRGRRNRLLRSTTVDGRRPLEMNCPHCSAACLASPGSSQCRACGGLIHVRIAEPECACGYVLFRMSSDHCPECGVVVPNAERYQVNRMEAGRAATGGAFGDAVVGDDVRDLANRANTTGDE